MGVEVRILIEATDEGEARRGAAAAFERIAAIEDVASDWRPSSEVMRLCAAPAGTEVEVSEDLAAMLACARRVSMASGGAFDVTIGAVTHLWREAGAEGRVPTDEQIADARERVDWRILRIDEGRRVASLDRAGVVIDLGGIAQGYAAGEALKVLEALGLGRAVVDVSGDIALGDPPSGRDGWRVAVPSASPGGWTTMVLSRCAVSTSGDTEQASLVLDGPGGAVRESHILDPERGRGIVGVRAVTILGPDAMLCDALATAVSVMGIGRGLELLERIGGYEGRAVVQEADGPREAATGGVAR